MMAQIGQAQNHLCIVAIMCPDCPTAKAMLYILISFQMETVVDGGLRSLMQQWTRTAQICFGTSKRMVGIPDNETLCKQIESYFTNTYGLGFIKKLKKEKVSY